MRRPSRRMLLSMAGLALLFLGWAAAQARPASLPHRDVVRSAERPARRITPDSLGRLTLGLAAGNPFRHDRRPSPTPYVIGGAPQSVASPPGAVHGPALVFTGVVGPPWRAVLEGASGRAGGVLVAAGDTIGGASVRAITLERVVLRTRDSSWTLTLRTP